MPTTWLLGQLAHAVTDPGALFLMARLAVALSVLAALGSAFSRWLPARTAALATALTLAQGTFIAHALEFRYDWAILVGWLAGFALVARRGRRSDFWLGVCAGWLAAHHLKGLFFAAALVAIAAWTAWREHTASGRRLAQLGAGFVLATGGWLLLSLGFGHGSDLFAVYTTFFELAAESEQRVWPGAALEGALRLDAAWWLAALGAVGVGLLGRRPRALSPASRHALLFALPTLAFLFVHPHAWAYMLALPAPFLALVMADLLLAEPFRGRRRTAVLLGLVLLAAIQWLLAGRLPGNKLADSFAAPRTAQVATLRRLRVELRPGDRVIDPSGLAYFVPPCVEEWYLDALFQERAGRGEWMTALGEVDLAECPWMLNTYRARGLPPELLGRLRGRYALPPDGGGLALAADDPRVAERAGWPALPWGELQSFW